MKQQPRRSCASMRPRHTVHPEHIAAAPDHKRWLPHQPQGGADATDLAKLVAGPGFEPGIAAYETAELPLLYPAKIKKPLPDWKGGNGEFLHTPVQGLIRILHKAGSCNCSSVSLRQRTEDIRAQVSARHFPLSHPLNFGGLLRRNTRRIIFHLRNHSLGNTQQCGKVSLTDLSLFPVLSQFHLYIISITNFYVN